MPMAQQILGVVPNMSLEWGQYALHGRTDTRYWGALQTSRQQKEVAGRTPSLIAPKISSIFPICVLFCRNMGALK